MPRKYHTGSRNTWMEAWWSRMRQKNPNVVFKSKYTMKHTDGGYQFTFFCAYCDFCCKTGWIRAESSEEARLLAENEARMEFNGCHSCGKWVCNDHYDMQAMMCVECASEK